MVPAEARGHRDGIIRYSTRYTAARSLNHCIDSTHVERLASIRADLLYQIDIAIIDELCRLSADGHGDQSVLSIEGLGVG